MPKEKCLWCGNSIERTEADYRFCKNCKENLEELESGLYRCNITEVAESILEDL